MFQNSLFLLNISEPTNTFASDSIMAPVVELKNNLIAMKNEANNWGFLLFIICFLIIVSIISNRNKFIFSLFNRLYRNKDRNSMFYESVTHESLNKIFLCVQTAILLSIVTYCYAVHENIISITTLAEMLLFTGKIFLLLIAFLLYKFISYLTTGAIFFKKETVTQWNDDFFSLIGINGIILFLPILILFYVEAAYSFCVYFLIFYLILNLIFTFHKIYSLFFHKKQYLLYFILYLCAQEIIPLYLVFCGIVFLITKKETIWM